jgi:2-polyprenyl-3-methyl-5-hydroxy-6-metoxy-1,4-benzoquinol methylase
MTLLRILKDQARAGLRRLGIARPSNVRISAEYAPLGPSSTSQIKGQWGEAWKDTSIPERQRAIVEPQLRDYRAGHANPIFDALVGVLKHNVSDLNACSLIEVGCSSGYYSQVLADRGIRVAYQGCDYSDAFVQMARRFYPTLSFDVEDATVLSYRNEAFDIVVSGGCILHIPDYPRAVSEAVRVSRRWVIFHRTPVLHTHETTMYTKKAYGVETVEIHFSEQELLRLFVQEGLRIMDVNTHSVSWDSRLDDALAWKTYLCEKV